MQIQISEYPENKVLMKWAADLLVLQPSYLLFFIISLFILG